jgi:hypothetical protein
MGDDSIDTVISYIDMGYLITLLKGTCSLNMMNSSTWATCTTQFSTEAHRLDTQV